jgi:hypothetical protein
MRRIAFVLLAFVFLHGALGCRGARIRPKKPSELLFDALSSMMISSDDEPGPTDQESRAREEMRRQRKFLRDFEKMDSRHRIEESSEWEQTINGAFGT